MGEVENKKLFEHYTNLINCVVKTGNPVRDDLIVSDAKRHLADLVKKNPSLAVVKQEPTPEPKPIEVKKETKSKETK